MEELIQDAVIGIADRRGSAYSFYQNFTPDTLNALYDNRQSEIVMEYLRKVRDDSTRWVRDEIKFLVDPSTGHLCLLLAVRDIHERKLAEQRLIDMAEHDGLTGLLNRSSLQMLVRKTLISSASIKVTHAMFILDMDNLKAVNDQLGHREGDRQLIRFGQTLQNCFRSSDLVARIGGDEFAVFMRYVSDQKYVQDKAEQLLSMLQSTLDADPTIQISASIGVSLYPYDGKTLDEMYDAADKAMYQAKHNGKNRVAFTSSFKQI